MSFIRPADSPFLEANRAAHFARWQVTLPARVDESGVTVDHTPGAGDPPAWPFDGRLTVRIEAAQGVWHKLHSDRRPIEESVAWTGPHLASSEAAGPIVVIGAGLGYVVETLTRSVETRVLVLEPETSVIPWFLARRDWTPLISSGRLLILPGPRYDAVPRALSLLRGTEQSAPTILEHPVLARLRPEAVDEARREAHAAWHGVRANALARRRFEAPYLLNTLANLATIVNSAGVDALRGTARGRPVVIAGAGPSLNRNIEELRPLRRQVVLVATDTALRPLLTAGLPPDFVVAVDPGPLNARHLAGIAVDDTTTLLAESSLDPSAFSAFGDRIITFRVANHAPWPWLMSCGVDRGCLRAWGSVLTTAFDVALEMGGNPIGFIGADLSYTLGQPYCRDTTYEADWARTAAQEGRSLVDVWEAITSAPDTEANDIQGTPVRTAPHLVAFRDWIVRAAEAATAATGGDTKLRVVNATGAGILHGPGIALGSMSALVGRVSEPPRMSPPASRTLASPPGPTGRDVDGHLLRHALSRGSSFPATVDLPVTMTPFLQRPRRQRSATTRQLRRTQVTDVARWSDLENIDRAWERRLVAAADLIPPGARVLDLGAGRQTLARHLPPGTSYTPADVVRRTSATVVADVNAGEFPDGTYDVVVMLGLLEHVHNVRRLLETAARHTSTIVVSYCAMTAWSREFRLEKGWLNDLRLGDLIDVFTDTGWTIAWAGRLDQLTHFDQWIYACRSLRPVR